MFSGNSFMDAYSGQGGPSMGGIQQLLSGLFGRSDVPYSKAMEMLQQYMQQAQGYQNPFYQAGTSSLPQFQSWLQGMKDPSGFINNLMGKYQESPYAKFMQEQGVRRAQNFGSASGLTGSTPLTQFVQQNAENISSQDMQNWLSRVLGINTEYGAGLNDLIGRGQHAGDIMSQLAAQFGEDMSGLEFGKASEQNKNRNDIFGGLFEMGSKGLFG